MFYVLLLFLLQIFYCPISLIAMNLNSGDGVALLSFKSLITHDPHNALSSWGWREGDRSLHFCQWRGITCHGGQLRVTALDHEALNLGGSISPSLSNLTYLQRLHIPENRLSGSIPNELGLLSNLGHLNMSVNLLQGEIPHSISQCSLLQNISMFSNSLTGPIPAWIGSLQKLELLFMSHNGFSGSIPSSLGNISALRIVDLAYNNLEGSIPESLGNLSSVSFLDLSRNNLVGDIPPSFGNMRLLAKLNLAHNNLSGSILESLGILPSITSLLLGSNKLTGRIPHSLWNLSSLTHLYLENNMLVGELPQHDFVRNMPRLQVLSLAANNLYGSISSSFQSPSALELIQLQENRLSGKIPKELGYLKSLNYLLLYDNNLEASSSSDWDFLGALANCTFLKELDISENEMLTGNLPNSVGNMSKRMTSLYMEGCQISGSIPSEIGNLISLQMLTIALNHFTGPIPESIGNLHMLNRLDFESNELSGHIPITLGNLTKLIQLYLYDNSLQGHIPSSLGHCKSLEVLSLQGNELTGSVPSEIFAITTIHALSISHNSLEGFLPQEVGSLINLVALSVSTNMFFGKIPDNIRKCVELRSLNVAGNLFQGVIPSAFDALKGLQELNLSNNRLSGQIPKYLQNLPSLKLLDLSVNLLEGEVPKTGLFMNVSAISVFGNDKLCGGIPEFRLPPCPKQGSKRRTWTLTFTSIVSVVGLALFVIMLLYGFRKWRRKLTRSPSSVDHAIHQHMMISYAKLLKATDQFSPENLIGMGSHGTVYKGNMMDSNEHNVIAVKVLNLHLQGASRSFDSECKVLKNIRHRNLVSVITSCSTTNYKGDDFKALVYEFMPNGSLENWLHPQINNQDSIRTLGLLQRMSIAIDVASAMDYLHNGGSVPVVHCDLKPSNVLLDDDMTAHVGDFGLARLLAKPMTESTKKSTSSTALKGTIGYVAPEYGVAGQVSTEGDVYSYGIMLLEMFTGKMPTEEIFKEGLNLYKFVEIALPNMIADIVDPMLCPTEEGGEAESIREMECITSVLNIGLSCAKDSPIERMSMSNALNNLQAIRNAFLGATNARGRIHIS